MDKSDNILNNLTTVNGREEPKPKKTAAKKTVSSRPLTTKSPERLNNCSVDVLAKLCKKFGVPFSDNKQEMINTLLGK
tara:strand:+ start:554 stop:787 length:234 start_codon:yes stop_codon:yes gene_type:complete